MRPQLLKSQSSRGEEKEERDPRSSGCASTSLSIEKTQLMTIKSQYMPRYSKRSHLIEERSQH